MPNCAGDVSVAGITEKCRVKREQQQQQRPLKVLHQDVWTYVYIYIQGIRSRQRAALNKTRTNKGVRELYNKHTHIYTCTHFMGNSTYLERGRVQ